MILLTLFQFQNEFSAKKFLDEKNRVVNRKLTNSHYKAVIIEETSLI